MVPERASHAPRSGRRRKKKARKQREKEAEGATAEGICAQKLANEHAKLMTNKQRKAEIAAGDVADDDSFSEEKVGLDIDAAAVPPIKEPWEQEELKTFVQYGPPADEACRPELVFLASARENVEAVELPSDGEGEAADRSAKSRLEARKKKTQFDEKHKKLKMDLGTPEGEIDLVTPNVIS
jgi:hypothetical protein